MKKKLYLLIAASAILGTAQAQEMPAAKYPTKAQSVVPIIGSNAALKQVGEKHAVKMNPVSLSVKGSKSQSAVTTDTLDSHFVGTPTLYLSDNSGYVSGHNGYGDLSKLQKFDAAYGVSAAGKITKVLFAFAVKKGNPASTINVKIWNDVAGAPGSVIGSVTIPYSQIDSSGLTTAEFLTPIDIPANKTFYAGFTLSYTPNDTLGLITTRDGDFPDAITHTWEEWGDNSFASIGDPLNGWGLDIALAVFPVVELEGTTGGNSDNVYYYENFDSGMPSDYAIIDVDGKTVNVAIAALFPNAWNIGVADGSPSSDSSLLSTSWYTPAGASDDWFITSAIIIPDTANSVFLSWEGEAIDPDYPDGYEVYISSTTQDVAGCMANPAIFAIAAEVDAPTLRKVDISSFIGDTIYIGFRNNSTDQFILSIDEIKVYQPSPYDITMNAAILDSADFVQYTRIPTSQTGGSKTYPVRVTLGNEGALAPTSVDVYVAINDGANVVYADTLILTTSIPAGGAIATFTMPTRFALPAGVGTHNLTLNAEVVLTAESDGDASNNSVNLPLASVTITDTVYARDNHATGNTSLSIGGGLTGYLGMVYDIHEADTLSAVTVVLRNANPMSNRKVRVAIFEAPNGTPDAFEIANSTTYTLPDAGTYTLPISGGVGLAPGKYVVAVNEVDSSVTVGTTTAVFTPGTVWVKSPGIAGGTWNLAESFGASFARTFYIRPIFGNTVIVGVKNDKVLNADVNLYPNPSTGSMTLTIQNPDANASFQLTITDMLGKVVKTMTATEGANFIDLTNEVNGMYLIKVQSGDRMVTKKVIINK